MSTCDELLLLYAPCWALAFPSPPIWARVASTGVRALGVSTGVRARVASTGVRARVVSMGVRERVAVAAMAQVPRAGLGVP